MCGEERKTDNYEELVRELSAICGVLPEYWDIFGDKHTTSVDTAKAILKAMKLRVDSPDEVSKEIRERRAKPWNDFIEPVHVMSVNEQPFSIPIYIPAEESDEARLIISWSLEDECGHKQEFALSGETVHISERRMIDGVRYVKVELADSKRRELGYYSLHAACKYAGETRKEGLRGFSGTSRIILTPDTCFLPERLQNGRAWGISINLYSVRSGRNWGIGDFGDLRRIIEWTAGLKGDFVGINPLHSIPNTSPLGRSPYSPISRIYRNFIYLEVEEIREVKVLRATVKTGVSRKFRDQLKELRKEALVDYEKVALLKETILRKAFNLFYKKHFARKTSRGKSFIRYAENEGACLESFALYMSLRKYMMKRRKSFVWQEWPEEYHRLPGKAVRKFREDNSKDILFYKYVQWLIDGQLRRVAFRTKKLGMTIGLYNDLAIGSIGGGSDAWSFRDTIASGADVGAPPDDFSPDGQKWGFPPTIPEQLKETGYELFIQTIRKNMKHAGALRIDHALGMFRLFWIPEGKTPGEGAYVGYPSEDLMRIVALESTRNRTVVIAEDLGTIGANVREALKRFWMLSYRLFYFERNYPEPSFLPPEKYPLMALCAVTTHDLPTIYGYWEGRDLERRRAIGKLPGDSVWDKQIEDRKRDKNLIISALKSEGVIPDDYPSEPAAMGEMTPELCRAIYHYLALTPCKMLLVSLDDIIGSLDQQNMPGTVDSHPNWVQKTAEGLDQLMTDRRFIDLGRLLKKYF